GGVRRGAVGRPGLPRAQSRGANISPKTESRPRPRYSGTRSEPQASVSCLATHSAVGWAVTPSHKIWPGYDSKSACHKVAERKSLEPQRDPSRQSPRHDCAEKSSTLAMEGSCVVPYIWQPRFDSQETPSGEGLKKQSAQKPLGRNARPAVPREELVNARDWPTRTLAPSARTARSG